MATTGTALTCNTDENEDETEAETWHLPAYADALVADDGDGAGGGGGGGAGGLARGVPANPA